jgi:ABC transporter transmembrane region
LFLPHRVKLAGLLVLVIAQSAASVASPFLLRGIVDHALPDRDDRLLTILAAGIVTASLTAGALGVAITWLSNTIGQEIMHDLRTSLYEHVQRMSLAFFTRTRAGELQSRIANDIGAIDNVLTSAAGTIVSSGTTMLAVIAALFALDWKLACFSVAVVPLLAWLNRRTGRTRRRISGRRQTQLADLTSLVHESLSVSGFLLARTMGRTDELNRRFRDESRRIGELEVEASMAGRWRVATVSMAFTILPACIYWLAGMAGTVTIGTLVAFTSMQNRLVSPVAQLLGVALGLSGSLAVFARIFESLDLPVDIAPGKRGLADPRGNVELRDVWFRYGDDWTLRGVDLTIPAGTRGWCGRRSSSSPKAAPRSPSRTATPRCATPTGSCGWSAVTSGISESASRKPDMLDGASCERSSRHTRSPACGSRTSRSPSSGSTTSSSKSTARASAAPTSTSTRGTSGPRRRSRCRWWWATSSSATSSRSAPTSPASRRATWSAARATSCAAAAATAWPAGATCARTRRAWA